MHQQIINCTSIARVPISMRFFLRHVLNCKFYSSLLKQYKQRVEITICFLMILAVLLVSVLQLCGSGTRLQCGTVSVVDYV